MRRFGKLFGIALLVVAIIAIGGVLWVHQRVAGSLPQLDGAVQVKGITAAATIERDDFGVPTVTAANRQDLAYALGFAHGQDRFFQMDTLRRNSAGELAELVGGAALPHDREMRVHRFRARAKRVLEAGSQAQRELLEAYAAGVNAGLSSLADPPLEYLLLRTEPAPWLPEDCTLALYSMYIDLQWDDFKKECALGVIQAAYPQAMFDFLAAPGSEWDAPIEGEAFALPPVPGADVVDLRVLAREKKTAAAPAAQPQQSIETLMDDCSLARGSNCWAVAGTHTTHGGALVADDMHLGIRVPNIWYRASLVWPGPPPAEGGQPTENRITGVTLPGTPAIVVGSNGHIAWGFTNSEGDWLDVVLIDPAPAGADNYLTPDGPKAFERHQEQINVKGGQPEMLEVVDTIWGPVIDTVNGRHRVARWVAHDVEGVNLGLMELETCTTLDKALELANLSGSPAQNFVVADKGGRIAWTILGRMPRRSDADGRLPASWADGAHRWHGYLNPEEYPRVVDPPSGRIWTANARIVSGDKLAKLRDGGYDLGARQGQIRDDLLKLDKASEADMLAIQLDDRAVLLERWQKLLLDVFNDKAVAGHPARAEARKQVADWGGKASIDSVGFRIVRAFRLTTVELVSDGLAAPCRKLDMDFKMPAPNRMEGPVWQLVTQKPEHLLEPTYKTWDGLLLLAADAVLNEIAPPGQPLAERTWGEANTSAINHPMSGFVPGFVKWGIDFDMPHEPLAGDTANMPRIQRPSSGASERLCVSPGREELGYFHMPCGQSGHPWSKNYRDGHSAWTEGRATPFLPGKTVHRLTLSPQ